MFWLQNANWLTFCPESNSLSAKLSTATLEGAQQRTFCFNWHTVWRIISTIVVVLPVPVRPRDLDDFIYTRNRVYWISRDWLFSSYMSGIPSLPTITLLQKYPEGSQDTIPYSIAEIFKSFNWHFDFLNSKTIRSFYLTINKRLKKHHIMRNQVNNQDMRIKSLHWWASATISSMESGAICLFWCKNIDR